jgi:hypothetical protein
MERDVSIPACAGMTDLSRTSKLHDRLAIRFYSAVSADTVNQEDFSLHIGPLCLL